jgi:ubiquinone/menaquinone biosynthesis C-methylase UbiE
MNLLAKQHLETNYLVYLKRRFQVEIRVSIVKELLSDKPKHSIIDLGCGDGSISLQFLPEAKLITLVDLSDTMLNICSKNIPQQYLNSVELVSKNIDEFITTRQYDVVLLLGVLAHVRDTARVMKKICECLRPGGVCIIQITDSAKFLSKLLYSYAKLKRRIMSYEDDYELRKMSFLEVHQIASSMGLTLLESARYFIPPLIHRLFNVPLGKKYIQAIMENKILRSFGSELILMYKSS